MHHVNSKCNFAYLAYKRKFRILFKPQQILEAHANSTEDKPLCQFRSFFSNLPYNHKIYFQYFAFVLTKIFSVTY